MILVLASTQAQATRYLDRRTHYTGEADTKFYVLTPDSPYSEGLLPTEVVYLTDDQELLRMGDRIIAKLHKVTLTYPSNPALWKKTED